MINSKILISIIVPVYNVEKYLVNCIESILNQTYTEFELILVDDGSQDNCGIICDNYARKDNRIKVIHKENGGLSSARNAGLDISIGKYVAFVDSDDWIDADMYKILLYIAEKNKSDIVQCDFYRVKNEDSIEIEDNINKDRYNINQYTNVEALYNLYNDKQIATTVSWNKLYNRELFKDIRFPIGKIHEDEFTSYKLIYKSNKIINIDKKLYYYRQTPNSIMNSSFNRKRLDILEALDERISFFKSLNNEELYEKSLKGYMYMLTYVFFACIRDIPEDSESIVRVRSKFIFIYKKYIQCKNAKIKTKINFLIFILMPKIYKKIKRI